MQLNKFNYFCFMIALAANKFFMRSKVANNAFETFDLMIALAAFRLLMFTCKIFRQFWTSSPLVSICDILQYPPSHEYALEHHFKIKLILNIILCSFSPTLIQHVANKKTKIKLEKNSLLFA